MVQAVQLISSQLQLIVVVEIIEGKAHFSIYYSNIGLQNPVRKNLAEIFYFFIYLILFILDHQKN